ncbi:lactose-binding lectin l-2-like [Saccostrea cucullata]|uniref:lactose-binding lectin l-2-like n=1 Tax=Saccostrea cuccullata TaxID=36930 RepID=UPI002ED481FE
MMYFILIGIFSISDVFCSWETCSENDVAYMFEEQKVNWYEAARRCEMANGTLATVQSRIEENCISSTPKESDGPYYIGDNKSSSGLWTWIDGTPITQPTYWASGEPNNAQGKENCLHFKLIGGVHYWNDISCDVLSGFVCQTTLTLTTESALLSTRDKTTLHEGSSENQHGNAYDE